MKKLITLLFFVSTISFSQNLVINEVMSSNGITISDEYGNGSDWLELFNGSGIQINLEGYYLSDDLSNVKKWRFGSAVMEPGGYMIVFCSDKDTLNEFWHTNFKISASGEKIILSDQNGTIVDSVFVPESLTDISYGRKTDGSSSWIFQLPTPGYKNSGSEIHDYSDSVVASIPGGFYSSPVSVQLSAGTSSIYYTLDGKKPDTTSTKYSGPINISKTAVLKAVSKKPNYLPSPVIYQTYLINESTDLPVISLSADPYDLFDPQAGIYTNFTQDWERQAHIEFFEDDKTPGFSSDCGINIHGSQSANWDQKSFGVKFKKEFNSSVLEYPLFPGFSVKKFNSIVLRNSGNDWQYTHIRDAMMQQLVKDLNIDYCEYRPATSFINGQYWGIYNIREKISENYIANRYGINPDNIDLLENNMTVLNGDSLDYQQILDYMASNDMSTSDAYNYLDSKIDLDECILYFAAQAYYDNLDWPGTNTKFWRERKPTGKWRWILLDLDFGFGLYAHGEWEDHIQFMFSPVETRYSNPPWATFFQRKLIQNPTIKNRFINQIADLLNSNFKSTRVVEIINSMADHISSEITKHRQRWNLNGEDLTKLTAFAQGRPGYLRSHVRSYFRCGDDASITIDASEGGTVKINTLSIDKSQSPWSGLYFQGNPVSITAIPKDGYKFDGWTGTILSNDKSLTVSGVRTTNLTALFSVDTSITRDIVINEINYNSSQDFETGDWVELYNKSDKAVDIGGWHFSDSDANHKFIFPAGTVMNPDSYLVLTENDSAFTARFPNVNNYLSKMGFGLSGSGEFIKLVNSDNQIIDSLTYSDTLPWPVEADAGGPTLELINALKDNSKPENWKASIDHGTPGKVNSIWTKVENVYDEFIPAEYSLSQNYPNPFNPSTVIRFQLPALDALNAAEVHVTLKIFDVLGREISTLVNEQKKPGNYEVVFDGGKLTSGVYFYTLNTGKYSETKKMILIK